MRDFIGIENHWGRSFAHIWAVLFKRMTQLLCTGTMGLAMWIVTILLASASVAQAQSSGAGSIPVGDADLTPSITVEYITTDNVFLTSNNTSSSNGVRVSPTVTLSAAKGVSELSLSYSGAFSTFDEDSLDYADHRLSFRGSQELNRRFRISGDASVASFHEELGTSLTEGIAEDFDEQVTFEDYRAGVVLSYGASQARGNLRFGLSFRDRSPTNLKSISQNSAFSNIRPFAEFSLRISSDTRLITGIEYSDVDYDLGTSRDRESVTAYTGLGFAATGKLSGSVRIGFSDIDFASAQVEDQQEGIVSASLSYNPVDYSRFKLTFTRDFDIDQDVSIDDASSEKVNNRFRLNWTNEWSSRVFHEASVSLSQFNRDCPVDSSETVGGSFSLNVFLQRWLIVGAGVSVDQREGDLCTENDTNPSRLDYDRQIFNVRLRATL